LTKRAMGQIVFEEDSERVLEVLKNALAFLRISLVRENVSGEGQRLIEVWGRRGLSFWSWGEIVGVKISGNEPRGCAVEVLSECVWPLQLFDNGTNKKNLESLFAALKIQIRAVGSTHLEERRFGSG
jgi:hypothetical protein